VDDQWKLYEAEAAKRPVAYIRPVPDQIIFNTPNLAVLKACMRSAALRLSANPSYFVEDTEEADQELRIGNPLTLVQLF
jgi:hypothetical protein